MKKHKFSSFAVAGLLCSAGALPTNAQTTTADSIEGRLKGVWLVEVMETVRALKITKAEKTADGSLVVEATFSGAPAKVSANASSSPFKLDITSAAGTLMSFTEFSPTTLTGTFTARSASGSISGVKFAPKVSAETASKCGASEGIWEGKWSQGNIGIMTLLLDDISSQCSALVRYGTVKETVKLIDGAFSFKCNTTTGGTCSFRPKGKELWVAYTNPQGGSNNGVFKQVE